MRVIPGMKMLVDSLAASAPDLMNTFVLLGTYICRHLYLYLYLYLYHYLHLHLMSKSELWVRGDTHTDKHTDTSIPGLGLAYWPSRVKILGWF